MPGDAAVLPIVLRQREPSARLGLRPPGPGPAPTAPGARARLAPRVPPAARHLNNKTILLKIHFTQKLPNITIKFC